MKSTLLLVLVTIGLVAGDGAWKENRVYQYKLQASSRTNKEGAVSRARLYIYPQSNDLLIGQIREAEYSKIDQQMIEDNVDFKDRQLTFKEWPLNTQFKIHLENGLIRSLSVERSMNIDQINGLKAIVSQFQLDTKAQNLIQSGDNNLPEKNNNNAFYKTMEPTVSGKCETTYDISVIPDYLIQEHQQRVPLPNLKKDGDFIKIRKTRNFNNCNERVIYTNGRADFQSSENQMNFERRNYQNDFTSSGNDMNYDRRRYQNDLKSTSNVMDSDRRGNQMDKTTPSPIVTSVMISGDLKTYTIQSTQSIGYAGGFYEYIEMTLESVEETNNRRQFRFLNLNSVGNMVNVGNLVYTSDVENNGRSMTDFQVDDRQTVDMRTSLLDKPRCPKAENAQVQWSRCWTAFPSADSICKNEFSPEWEDVGTSCCGFLCFGKQAKCRRSYPGCVSTVCYSVFVPIDTLCKDQFQDKYPVRCRGFVDCAPGFYGARCCPASYQ